jgi:hypothetical protein
MPRRKQNIEKNSAILVSRDEMNLAEFPLTVLSTRISSPIKTLEFNDSIKGKNGQLVERQWIITGADKFGLPTSSDDEVLLGLLKLSVDDGMRRRKVYFTRYELLKILRWSTEGRSYLRLQKALDRLSGVRIKATNAFFDNEIKNHSTKNFGLIDSYEISAGRDGDLKSSFFEWSEVMFNSFQVGFIKKLDLDFYLTLQSAVSKRLYRYLDKHFWYKSTVSINLFTLAHEKIGVSRNYKYASSLKQQLDPAFDELISQKFIEKINYEGRGHTTVVTIYAANGKKSLLQHPKINSSAVVSTELDLASEGKPRSILEPVKTEKTFFQQILIKLTQRGISEGQALRLIEHKDDKSLERISHIIDHFDQLLAQGDAGVIRSPIGFLYRAVERAQTFRLPSDRIIKERPTSKISSIIEKKPARLASSTSRRPKVASANTMSNEALYLIERKKQIATLREKVGREIIESITQEVLRALIKLKPLISPTRFSEAVEHAIDEKLASKYQLPSFDEWIASSLA